MSDYTITWLDEEEVWEMNGKHYKFVGEHLYDIAKANNITTSANSETHHLAIIRASGVSVALVEEDGSKVIW